MSQHIPSEGAKRVNRQYPRKVEISRAVAAAKECGIEVAGIEISRNGSIKVLGPGGSADQLDEFEQWDRAGRL